MKKTFSQIWKSRKDRGELLEKRHGIELSASQLSSLLFDSDVRGSLQKSRVVSLLPPVGTEVFRRLTPDALEQIKKCPDSQDYGLKPANELKSGKTLPFFLGAPPPDLQDVPLEDIDPFYQSQKTFVVVSKTNVISRFNAASSCFSFSPFSLFRRAAIKILNHRLFAMLMLVTLLMNCVFMMTSEPPHWDYIAEYVFLTVYSMEAVLKILSKGFCVGPFTYLRDSWDRLDLFIVVTGLLTVLLDPLKVLKCFRALKILGLYNDSRRFVSSFGRSVKRLVGVLFVSVCVLSFFAIIGTQLFMGSLRNKCIKNLTNNTELDFASYIYDSANTYFLPKQMDGLLCGNYSSASMCPEGYTCLRAGRNPNYGFTNFDSFGWSLLSTFRLMMRDFWENLAQLTMRANGRSTFIYFVLALFVCSFSLFGFIVATFTIIFTEQNEEELKEVQQNEKGFSEILSALRDKVGKGPPEKTDCDSPSPECAEPKPPRTCRAVCLSCLRVVCSCDCCGCWIKVKNGLQVFVLDPFFDVAIIICIVLNVVFVSMEHYPMTQEFEMMMSLAELIFSLIFFLEVVLKMLALGVYGFFQVRWHIFDTVLVLLSLTDLGLVYFVAPYYSLRLFRLCRWWPCFLKWLRLVWASLRSLWSVTLSLVLTVLFFSVFGMYFFGGDYQEKVCQIAQDCKLPRWHMHDFFHSFMLVTRALCGEWIETMWDCMEVSHVFTCVAFYMTLLLVGNVLAVTLFMGLLMKWISDRLSPKDQEKMETLKTRISYALRLCGVQQRETKELRTEPSQSEGLKGVALTCLTEPTELKDCDNGNQSSTLPIKEHQTLEMVNDDEESPEDCCCEKCYSCSPCGGLDQSQGCGRVWANIRRSCFNILQHKYFNNFILFIVLISSATLVFEDIYLDSRPALKTALQYTDQVITIVFLLEALFKWVGYGFKRYFRDGWCWLDFIVTLACVLSVVAQMTAWAPFLQSLKALRPLRILPHITCTRMSVVALLRLVPSLVDVLMVGSTVWLFFGILGVNFFAGKFLYCFNETSEEVFSDDFNKTQCFFLIENNYTEVRWKHAELNFDSISSAFLSLFQVAMMKGWITILYAATDGHYVEENYRYENNIYIYLYFLAFILFGCFFTFNLILKVIFDAYNKFEGRQLFLTQKQLKWLATVKSSERTRKPPPRPQGRIQGLVFDMVTRPWFEVLSLVLISLYVLILMTTDFNMTELQEHVTYWIFFVLILLFVLEIALRMFALRPNYFKDNLNKLDLVLILFAVVGLFLSDVLERYFISPHFFPVLRLVRFSRVVHLVPGLRRIRLLYRAFTMSLRAVFNLGLVLFVLMLVYSSFATFHFSHLNKSYMVDDMIHFETFVNSLICMFMVTTWAGWDGLLLPMLQTPPDCDPLLEQPGTGAVGDCGNAAMGVGFFVSYLCLSSYLVLMMFIVLVVEMMNAFAEMSGDPLSDHNLQMFFKTWSKFDPKASQLIQSSQVPELCEKLKEPLRIVKPNTINMGLSLHPGDKVHCRDVLLALAGQALGDGADEDALKATIEQKYPTFMPNNPFQESLNQEEAVMAVTDQQMEPDDTEE